MGPGRHPLIKIGLPWAVSFLYGIGLPGVVSFLYVGLDYHGRCPLSTVPMAFSGHRDDRSNFLRLVYLSSLQSWLFRAPYLCLFSPLSHVQVCCLFSAKESDRACYGER